MSGTASAELQQLVLSTLGFAVKSDWLDAMLPQVQPAAGGTFMHLPRDQQLQIILDQLLPADFRAAGAGGHLPASVKDLHKQMPQGKFMLQLDEAVNIAAGFKERYRDQGSGRCLKLHLTDGVQDVIAMEYRFISALAVLMPAGVKLLVVNPEVRRGMLLLQPENVVVMGGMVERLEAARQALLQHVNKPADHCAQRRTSEQVYQQAAAAAWANAGHFQQQQQQQAEAQTPSGTAANQPPAAGQQQTLQHQQQQQQQQQPQSQWQQPQQQQQQQQPLGQQQQQPEHQQWGQPPQHQQLAQQQWQGPAQQQGHHQPVQQPQHSWQQQQRQQGPAVPNSWQNPHNHQQQQQHDYQQQQQQQQSGSGLMLPPLHPPLRRTPPGLSNPSASTQQQQQQQHMGASAAVASGGNAGLDGRVNRVGSMSSSGAHETAAADGGGDNGGNDVGMDPALEDFDYLDDIPDYMMDDDDGQQQQQQSVDGDRMPGSTAEQQQRGSQQQQHEGVGHARSASRAAAAAAADVSSDDDIEILDSQHDADQNPPGARPQQQQQQLGHNLSDIDAGPECDIEAQLETALDPSTQRGGSSAVDDDDSDIDMNRALDRQLEEFQSRQKRSRISGETCPHDGDRSDALQQPQTHQQHQEGEHMDQGQVEQQQQRKPVLQRRRTAAQELVDNEDEHCDMGWGDPMQQRQQQQQQEQSFTVAAAAATAGLENQAPDAINSKLTAAAAAAAILSSTGRTGGNSRRVLSVSQHRRDLHLSQQQQQQQDVQQQGVQQQQLGEPWRPQQPPLLGPVGLTLQQRQQGHWRPRCDAEEQYESPSTVPSPPLTEPSPHGSVQQPAVTQTPAAAAAPAVAAAAVGLGVLGPTHAAAAARVVTPVATPAAGLAGPKQQVVTAGQGLRAQGSGGPGSSGLSGGSRRGSGGTVNPLVFEKSDPLRGRRSSVSTTTAAAAGAGGHAVAVVTPGAGSSAAACNAAEVTPAAAAAAAANAGVGGGAAGSSEPSKAGSKHISKPAMDALFDNLLQALDCADDGVDNDDIVDLGLPSMLVDVAVQPDPAAMPPAAATAAASVARVSCLSAAAKLNSGNDRFKSFGSSSNGRINSNGPAPATVVAQQQQKKSGAGSGARKHGGGSSGSGSSKLSSGSGGKSAGSDIRAVFARANEFAAAGALPLKNSAAGYSRNGLQKVQKVGVVCGTQPAAAAAAAGAGVIVLDGEDDVGRQIEQMDDDNW